MSAETLRAKLEPLLSDLLGIYIHPDGTEQSAIFAGDPPNEWLRRGLECRIGDMANLTPGRYNSHTQVSEKYRVYLVAHKLPSPNPNPVPAADPQTAARLLVTGFDTNTPTFIPENERLGTFNQYVLTIEERTS